MKPFYLDLADLDDDQRIGLIGRGVMAGYKVAFVVDPNEAERYINKLTTQFPASHVIERLAGRLASPIPGTVVIRVSLPISKDDPKP